MADPAPSSDFPISAGILLGLGIGGFFDGIVLHQLLQWHHLVTSAGHPPDSVENLKINTFWDGVFHAGTYLFVLAGLLILWRHARRAHGRWSARLLPASLLVGFGLFNLVEGTINHQILGLHHVNETVPPEQWWLGSRLSRLGSRHGRRGPALAALRPPPAAIHMNPAPLILTLALDETSFRFFDEQRRRFFPRERNHIPAHVTLFHALPGDEIDTIVQDLASACAAQPPFPVAVTGLRALGRGVAYQLSASDLAQLRQALARRWADWLTPQDRQKLNPHVTVQNKVDPEEARALLASLQESFEPFMATGEGLDLWWYRGGPWERVERFAFQGRSLPAEASP